MEKKYKKLGDVLIEKGIINPTELERALELQQEYKKPLGEVLVQMGYSTWDQIVRALAEQYEIEACISKVSINKDLISKIKKEIIQELKIIPIAETNEKIKVGIANVYDISVIRRRLKFLLGKDVEFCLMVPNIFEEILQEILHGTAQEKVFQDAIGDISASSETFTEEKESNLQEDIDQEATPVIRLVSNIINHAIEMEASDIHIEPQKKTVVVRYRVDGVLKIITEYPKNMHNAVVTRIKILSNLDIVERRLPQDGKSYVKKGEEQFDLRISTMPSVHGEKVVFRILRVSSAKRTLEDSGYSSYNYERLKYLIDHPYGIILVTGPTGSGKSTTLVSILNTLNTPDVNIVTAEDPVEYSIDGITQCQVNSEIGLTFARYLRAFLRQDPDIIMVGETRDRETAQLAVEASLTGHLVFSTLHTNTAPGAVDRLLNMGIDPSLISASLIGVIGQRLVRKVCPKCKEEVPIPEKFVQIGRQLFGDVKTNQFVGKGCDYCKGTGYKGRTAVAEVMVVNDEIRKLIRNAASEMEIRAAAKRNGMFTMFEDGLNKVFNGETTIEEVLSIVGEGD